MQSKKVVRARNENVMVVVVKRSASNSKEQVLPHATGVEPVCRKRASALVLPHILGSCASLPAVQQTATTASMANVTQLQGNAHATSRQSSSLGHLACTWIVLLTVAVPLVENAT